MTYDEFKKEYFETLMWMFHYKYNNHVLFLRYTEHLGKLVYDNPAYKERLEEMTLSEYKEELDKYCL